MLTWPSTPSSTSCTNPHWEARSQASTTAMLTSPLLVPLHPLMMTPSPQMTAPPHASLHRLGGAAPPPRVRPPRLPLMWPCHAPNHTSPTPPCVPLSWTISPPPSHPHWRPLTLLLPPSQTMKMRTRTAQTMTYCGTSIRFGMTDMVLTATGRPTTLETIRSFRAALP